MIYDYPVTVSASAAKQLTVPARHGHSDMRSGSGALAGSYPFETGDEVVTGWHHHDLHQLEYAFEGVARVETADAHYLLPPRQAAWIPAGVEHRAMALLAEPAPSVLAVATAVGFDSPGGFTRAFRRYTGETPLACRRRVTTPQLGSPLAATPTVL
jgi:quercetin dioxygenase-like cupin family protein